MGRVLKEILELLRDETKKPLIDDKLLSANDYAALISALIFGFSLSTVLGLENNVDIENDLLLAVNIIQYISLTIVTCTSSIPLLNYTYINIICYRFYDNKKILDFYKWTHPHRVLSRVCIILSLIFSLVSIAIKGLLIIQNFYILFCWVLMAATIVYLVIQYNSYYNKYWNVLVEEEHGIV